MVAATALILSNSPVAVATSFAENKTSDAGTQSAIQLGNQMVDFKPAAIDQSIYGNSLKNPTLRISGNQLTDWTIRPT